MKQLLSNCKLNGHTDTIASFMRNFSPSYLHVYAPKLNVPDEDLVMLGYVDNVDNVDRATITTNMYIIQISRSMKDNTTRYDDIRYDDMRYDMRYDDMRYDMRLFFYDKVTNSFKLTISNSAKLVEIVHTILAIKGCKTVTNGQCEVLFKSPPKVANLFVLHDGNLLTESKVGQTYRFKTPTTERKCENDVFVFTDDFTGLLNKLQELKSENAYDKYTIDGDTLYCSIDRQVESFISREVKLPDDATAMKIAEMLKNSIGGRKLITELTQYVHQNTATSLSICFSGKKLIVEKRYQAYKPVGEV